MSDCQFLQKTQLRVVSETGAGFRSAGYKQTLIYLYTNLPKLFCSYKITSVLPCGFETARRRISECVCENMLLCMFVN